MKLKIGQLMRKKAIDCSFATDLCMSLVLNMCFFALQTAFYLEIHYVI